MGIVKLSSLVQSTHLTDTQSMLSLLGNKLLSFTEKTISNKLNKIIANKLSSALSDVLHIRGLDTIETSLDHFLSAFNKFAPIHLPSNDGKTYVIDAEQNKDVCKKLLVTDPHIKGLFAISIQFPSVIRDHININNEMFTLLAKSVTLPAETLQHSERHGLSNRKLPLPTTRDFNREITIEFFDTYELPIRRLFTYYLETIISLESGFHKYQRYTDIISNIIVTHFQADANVVSVDLCLGCIPTQINELSQSKDDISLLTTSITFTITQFIPFSEAK